MSFSGSGDEQSEDGELRQSPDTQQQQHQKHSSEIIDFSLSEDDGDNVDSLDIKPPQARVAGPSSRSKRRLVDGPSHESRSSHHKRSSERHRDERHSHREKYHREKQPSSRSAKEKEHFQREKERYYREQQQLATQQYSSDIQYVSVERAYRKDESTGGGSSSRHQSTKYEEKKIRTGGGGGGTLTTTATSNEVRTFSSRVLDKHRRYEEEKRDRADKTLQDLRERLLSKRTTTTTTGGKVVGDDDYHHRSAGGSGGDLGVKADVGSSSHHRDRKYCYRELDISSSLDTALEGEAGMYVKEIINISTNEERSTSSSGRHHRRSGGGDGVISKSREDDKLTEEERAQQEQRRDKLLEAEREMARLKEQSRVERERRHLEKATKRQQQQEDEEQQQQQNDFYNKRLKLDESNIVTVSDNTDNEIDDECEEIDDDDDDDDNNKSDIDSVHNSSSTVESRRYSLERSDHSTDSRERRHRHRSLSSERKSQRSHCTASSDDSDRSDISTSNNNNDNKGNNNTVLLLEKESGAGGRIDHDDDDDNDLDNHHNNVDDEEMNESKIDENLPPYYPAIQGCRSVEEFQCLNRIEEGTYGVVYRARDKRTEEIVALKRLKMEKEKEGFPITSLREINTLLKGQHPNIVTVREIVVGSNMDKIFIVMDYVEHDLKSLMETMRHKKQNFMPGEVKCLLRQLLLAVAHLHDNWILHRDLKTSNLLLSHKGILKVGDFGLAREYGSPLKAYTPIVVTLWYRAPELLLCTKEYSTPIDMWSVGCIFAELLLMNALFPGKSEVDQLNRVFKDLGTPNEKIWPGYNKLPAVQKMKFTEYPVSNLRAKFNSLSELGIGLLTSLLTFDPFQRITAEEAVNHMYFNEAPLPIDPAMFPTWPAKSELGQKRALAASPKPPSGGGEYKKLGGDVDDDGYGFRIGMCVDNRRMGAGFSLKF